MSNNHKKICIKKFTFHPNTRSCKKCWFYVFFLYISAMQSIQFIPDLQPPHLAIVCFHGLQPTRIYRIVKILLQECPSFKQDHQMQGKSVSWLTTSSCISLYSKLHSSFILSSFSLFLPQPSSYHSTFFFLNQNNVIQPQCSNSNVISSVTLH